MILMHGSVSESLLHHSGRIHDVLVAVIPVTPIVYQSTWPIPPLFPSPLWFNSLPFYLWALVEAFCCILLASGDAVPN